MEFLFFNGVEVDDDTRRMNRFNKVAKKLKIKFKMLCCPKNEAATTVNFSEAVEYLISSQKHFILFAHLSGLNNVQEDSWKVGDKNENATVIIFSGGGVNPGVHEVIQARNKLFKAGFSRVWHLKPIPREFLFCKEFLTLIDKLNSQNYEASNRALCSLNNESIEIRTTESNTDASTQQQTTSTTTSFENIRQRKIEVVPERILNALWILSSGNENFIPENLRSRTLRRDWWLAPFRGMEPADLKNSIAMACEHKNVRCDKIIELLSVLADENLTHIIPSYIDDAREELKIALQLI